MVVRESPAATKYFIKMSHHDPQFCAIITIAIKPEGSIGPETNSDITERFRRYLRDRELLTPEIDGAIDHLSEFFQAELPEIDALPAVRELRWQAHRHKVEPKAPYPGKRQGVEAIPYLLREYGDEIRSGALGSGRLHTIDSSLCSAVVLDLRRANPPMTIGEFFAQQSGGRVPGTILQRRIRAFAEILDTTEPEAASLLAGKLVPRLRNAARSSSSGQSR
jgi:hypothetical protein